MPSEPTRTAVERAAQALLHADRTGDPIEPISASWGDITIADSYAIQLNARTARLTNGERLVGRKIGLTSQAMQDMLGVRQPDFGYITDTMLFASPASLGGGNLIEPRVEAEIAFRFARPLASPVTPKALLAAQAEIAPALEIIDSRIADWRITIADTIADNASSALVVVGTFTPLQDDADLAALEATLTVTEADGSSASVSGSGSAVLGHPANAIEWLAKALRTYANESIEPGQIVLPGAMARALPFGPAAAARATFDLIGTVEATL